MSDETPWRSDKDKWLHSHDWNIEKTSESAGVVISDCGSELFQIHNNMTSAEICEFLVEIRNDIVYNIKYYSA